MLYKTLDALIDRGLTDGLAEKIDIFFATGKLTQDEYDSLIARLG